MLFSDYRFTLDLHKTQSQISIPVTLGDTARKLYISFSVRGVPYVIKDGCRAVFSAKKADGTTLFNDCIIEDNMTVRYDFTANTATAEGITDCRILLYGANGRLLATPRFIMVVDKKVVYDDEIAVSDSERTSIDNMMLAETVRVNAEAERVASEMARTTAENDRVSAESVRAEAESQRLSAEKDRQTSEKERIAAETARVSAEKTRVDNETTRVSAENQRNSNEQTRTASETGRIDAEKKRVSAEDLRIESETTRVQSEALRKSAEILRNQNESKRESNETERISAEAERVSAEKDRATSEENRKTAERERVTAESARTKAEEARLSAEKERVSAETARKSAETVRSDQENIRIENENARVANETARKTNETGRVNNEDTRKANETSRIVAENVRLYSEEIRASAEETRKGNETVRVANETERIQNETARKAEFDTWSSEVGKISAFDKRISNIEAAVMPELVTPTVDKTVAHRKDVPENVLPFASINEIGGMSYKCNNLIPFPYVDTSKTANGITFVVNDDGSVTANGTATKETFFKFKDVVLSSGTYYLSGNPDGYSYTTFFMYVINLDDNITYKGNRMFEISDVKSCSVYIRVALDVEISNQTFRPMLNEGETALPYEPYFTGLRDAKVTVIESVGANLIPFPYYSRSQIISGVKVVVNSDGSLTLSGSNTSANVSNFQLIANQSMTSGTYRAGMQKSNDNTGVYAVVGVKDKNTQAIKYYTENMVIEKDSVISYYVQFNVGANFTTPVTVYPMLNKGETALPYKPYTKNTIEIPEAVQALDGYGQGVNAEYCNKIVLDPASGVKKFVQICGKKAYESGDESREDVVTDGATETVYVLDSAIETDISEYFTDDNLIGVEASGTVTAVNEHEYDVPFEVEYMVKGGGTGE